MPYQLLVRRFFRSGDIIYGLDAPRRNAVNAIVADGFQRNITYERKILCRVSRVSRAVVLIQNDLTNAVWDPLNPNKYSSNRNIKNTLHGADAQRGIAFKRFLSTHPNYNVASQGVTAANAPQAWKRTSKGGLEFQLRGQRGRIHFILDNIYDPGGGINTIQAIAQKDPTQYGDSITSSELRWLYRHRHVLEIQQLVFFWTARRRISQQDFFNDPNWNFYHPTHEYDRDWRSIMPQLVRHARRRRRRR